jgi:hypothetical protein
VRLSREINNKTRYHKVRREPAKFALLNAVMTNDVSITIWRTVFHATKRARLPAGDARIQGGIVSLTKTILCLHSST